MQAAGEVRGEEALDAMGQAYVEMVPHRPDAAARADAGVRGMRRPGVRDAMRAGYGDSHLFVETVSGPGRGGRRYWFAGGMLLNVIAAMDLLDASRALGAPPLEGAIGAERSQATGEGS